jgi:hypothetical protein
MAGYDDPRYLKTVIEDLQKKVKRLEMGTLPLLSYQRGPTPGWQNAGQIGPGPGMKASMHLHLDGNQVGVAPRGSITDANGIVRAEFGNLAASGVSPAQYGFRASDASGTPIFDSLGLISVMQQLGHIDNTTSSFSTTSATPVLITNSSLTFSLSRSLRVLILWWVQCFVNNASGIGEVDLFIDGVSQTSTWPPVLIPNSGLETTGVAYWSQVLASGSHTASLRASAGSGNTIHVDVVDVIALQLGS